MKRVGVMGFAYCIFGLHGLHHRGLPRPGQDGSADRHRRPRLLRVPGHLGLHHLRPLPYHPSLYLLYPCSWTLTAIAEIAYFIHAYKDSMKIFTQPQSAEV